jgi:hypothetical protein
VLPVPCSRVRPPVACHDRAWRVPDCMCPSVRSSLANFSCSAAPLTGQLHAARRSYGASTAAQASERVSERASWGGRLGAGFLARLGLKQPSGNRRSRPRGLPGRARFGSIQIREPVSRHPPGEARAEVAD